LAFAAWVRQNEGMCRFVAYRGEPIFLEELVARPQHSLLQQSLHAEHAKTVTNGDGFGIGWYGEKDEPAVYREVMPAWSDENLLALTATVRAGLFFAHVRAATGGGIARSNCHPFRMGEHLFMHNGQIGGFPWVRRALEGLLPDHLYAHRKGATDSELLFLLALSRIEEGLEPGDAVMWALGEARHEMRRHGITEPLRFAAALSNGEQLHVFRISSDDRPPSLYLQQDGRGVTVASEPLAGDEGSWNLIPAGAVLCIGPHGVEQRLEVLH
jgi:glutamine amidotransferase